MSSAPPRRTSDSDPAGGPAADPSGVVLSRFDPWGEPITAEAEPDAIAVWLVGGPTVPVAFASGAEGGDRADLPLDGGPCRCRSTLGPLGTLIPLDATVAAEGRGGREADPWTVAGFPGGADPFGLPEVIAMGAGSTASSLRLLTFIILRSSGLLDVALVSAVPFFAWASPFALRFVIFSTLPFWPSVVVLFGLVDVGCLLEIAGGLTGSRRDCWDHTKEKEKRRSSDTCGGQ